MNNAEQLLLRLPPKPVRAMIEQFHAVRRRAAECEDQVIPVVTFHLRSGRNLCGSVLTISQDAAAHSDALLIEVTDETGRSTDKVAYLDPCEIEAITVHGAGLAMPALSFGAIESPLGAPAPTKLAIRRRSEELAKSLADAVGSPIPIEVDWEQIPAGGEPLRSLSFLIEDTAAAALDLVKEFGPQELAANVKCIQFAQADQASVTITDHHLAVVGDLSRGKPGRLSRVALAKAIAAAL